MQQAQAPARDAGARHGRGWGSFAAYAAERHGVQVTGITVSEDQVQLGRKLCADLPVEIRLQDYRDVSGSFDRVVSLGMLEHVGYKNYRTYMETVRNRLTPDGVFLLQTIGGNVSVRTIDPWINRYIFPNAMLPSVAQIGAAVEGLFVMEDWENFGPDYDRTLLAWFKNFDASWDRLKSLYPERFYRMWKYYLMFAAGSFRCRKNQVWQIVFSRRELPVSYDGFVNFRDLGSGHVSLINPRSSEVDSASEG